MTTRIAIFASGAGSNAEKICDYFSGCSDINVVLIFSNNPNSFVLNRRKMLAITRFVFNKQELKEYLVIKSVLKKYKVDFIVLAGFLLKIPKRLVLCYPKKIINLHPSLLPKYGGQGMYGQYVHQAVIDAKEKESGISVHFVNSEYDKGVIVFQKTCVVDKNETASSLEKKIRVLELSFFPKVIEQICLSL